MYNIFLELIIKISECKIDMQKSIVFLQSSSEHMDTKIKITDHLHSPQRIQRKKFVSVKLTKHT